MSPCHSDDLTTVVVKQADLFVVFLSPASAGEAPKYEQIASFPTLEKAETYLRTVI